MWRTGLASVYWILTVVLMAVNIILLFVMTITFIEANMTQQNRLLRQFLVGSIVVAVVVNLMIISYTLIFYSVTNRLDQRKKQQKLDWTTYWINALSDPTTIEETRLTDMAIRTLIEMRRSLRGGEAEKLDQIIEKLNIERYWQKKLAWWYFSNTRLYALEILASIGTRQSLSAVVRCHQSTRSAVRLAALRATAAILDRIHAPIDSQFMRAFTNSMVQPDVPLYVVEDICVSLKNIRLGFIQSMLQHKRLRLQTRRILVRLVGDFKLIDLIPIVQPNIYHQDPLLKAAALQSIARTEYMIPGTEAAVLSCLKDSNPTVRLQALMAVRQMPLYRLRSPMWRLLQDPAWDVRMATGEVLIQHGEGGRALLKLASEQHPDPLARQLAASLLDEREQIRTSKPAEWIWASV